MVILLKSWGLQIAKNHLNYYSKCVLSPTSPRIVPFENAKVPIFKGCSKQNGDSAYWLGPGNSSKTSILSFQTYMSSAFSHLKVLNFKNWGKWNLCLLAGKGVEMAKKLLDWVSRHLFFLRTEGFSLIFPFGNHRGTEIQGTVGSRMVILLISWGLPIAKNHLS